MHARSVNWGRRPVWLGGLLGLVGLLLAALSLATPVAAQGFPSKPLRLVVPNAPGGAADLTARAVGQRLGEALGQPVVIDNKPGAGGV